MNLRRLTCRHPESIVTAVGTHACRNCGEGLPGPCEVCGTLTHNIVVDRGWQDNGVSGRTFPDAGHYLCGKHTRPSRPQRIRVIEEGQEGGGIFQRLREVDP